MATRYLTISELAEIIGEAHLVAAAPDPDSPDAWLAPRVQGAIDDVGERVDAALRASYDLPLPDVPGFLSRAVARIVHAELVPDEAAGSELIASRGKAAEKLVAQVASGQLRVAGDLDADPADANARTRQGRAILAQRGARQFRRGDTAGVV